MSLFSNNEQIRQQRCSTPNHLEAKKDNLFIDSEKAGFERDCFSKSTSFPLDKSIEKVINDSIQENDISSSPQILKINSDSLLNISSNSLSPLHQKHYSPKNGHINMAQKSDKVSQLSLSDFLIDTPIPKRKTKKGNSTNDSFQRITPTSLSKEKVGDFKLLTLSCFNDFDIKEVANCNERNNFLMEAKSKVLTNPLLDENNLTILSRKLRFIGSSSQDDDVIYSTMNNEKALNNLSKIYITILNNYFVLNITSEIYFLIMLLIKKQFCLTEDKQDDFQNSFDFLENTCKKGIDLGNNIKSCSNFLKTIPNIIYFVVKSLESQINILKYFDKTTLMLLSNNYRLKTFSKKFAEELRKLSEMKCDKTLELSDILEHTNVYFNLDTDNRDNFPSDISFHSFRKQRDLFYEILRIWEMNHLQPGWSFSVGLGGKIKNLTNLVTDPTNFVYLCRLFKDQLLRTCGKYHKVSISYIFGK